MPQRHRILLQSNPTWLRTGLSENVRVLLRYLYQRRDKYEIAHLCTQGTMTNDPKLALTPWKSYGSIPADQEVINRLNADPGLARNASYGSLGIDAAIKDWQPTIWIGSDDVWSHPLADYADKPWYQRIHGIHHSTVDSVPVLEQAFEQARKSKHYLTWAKFAAKEMQRVGGVAMSHVSSIYGASDTTQFAPISEQERQGLRARFGIAPDTVVFLYVSRNQLRKEFPRCLEALAQFKRDNPRVKAVLHFHTSFSEKGAGWDIMRLAAYYGLAKEDVLCTYVCKACGQWLVAPYQGEDINCPQCGAEKSMVSANIINAVPGDQMKYIYGTADGCINVMTSGGQELSCVQSLLCGKPLAVTNYSCGEDYCLPETEGFVYPIRWRPTNEAGTSFVKAASDSNEIARFMRKVAQSSKKDLQASGERGREWAKSVFSIETVGAQWEKLFDSLNPNLDWSSVDITKPPRKNAEYVPSDEVGDNETWVRSLYKNILNMDVSPNDDGLKHWTSKLQAGLQRQPILDYFRQVARQENAKNGYGDAVGAAGPTDLASVLDNTGRKRALFLIKESIGDCLICTQLFESFHDRYPNHDLYVMTSPQYAEVFVGNPNVHKILPYIPQAESELIMTGAGQNSAYFDVYFHPAIQSQRQLHYLSHV